jgi:predicted lipoprotein with Yx(FWY)xxD motif
MTRTTIYAAILMAGTALLPQLAAAAAPVTDDKGMTLYVFDNDKGGVPSCYDACATKWPPYVATADEKKGEGWTMVDRTDKTKQWAYDGKPVYFFAGDKAKGDTTGDGLGGVWHDIVE